MTAHVSAPRYSADDFDTASIRSAAPSYVSEVPSYHSRITYSEASPAYTPAAPTSTATTTTTTATSSSSSTAAASTPRQIFSAASSSLTGRQPVGLPPLPPLASPRVLNDHSFRIPTWSAGSAPAARHYRKVAERRVIDGRFQAAAEVVGMRDTTITRQSDNGEGHVVRPLEDPYLVGEQAAAEARQQRIAREVGESMLREEDKQWDWMLAQMKTWEERERNWTRFRQEATNSRRKTLFRRIGGRLL
ncbi:hypothetical protein M419DRAFT_112926 [Trichoderma reesei RUT C-30]|uniref:Uncharacterized protein n=1 Tax=Hypocrea jecorina (strain ATCC 56765 / BCRC 32924 / NRRL 11460 / Rut C-30) TaxID=1344414 RepID=A0A024S4S5_HYPJR|nr:hypothetical protein M419DRAFT_112926 [Trichoderma reesei RUT C-30]